MLFLGFTNRRPLHNTLHRDSRDTYSRPLALSVSHSQSLFLSLSLYLSLSQPLSSSPTLLPVTRQLPSTLASQTAFPAPATRASTRPQLGTCPEPLPPRPLLLLLQLWQEYKDPNSPNLPQPDPCKPQSNHPTYFKTPRLETSRQTNPQSNPCIQSRHHALGADGGQQASVIYEHNRTRKQAMKRVEHLRAQPRKKRVQALAL
jgi:hypothetical protein